MGLQHNTLTEHTKGITLLLLLIILLSPNELYSELVTYMGNLGVKIEERWGEPTMSCVFRDSGLPIHRAYSIKTNIYLKLHRLNFFLHQT